jgi:hypothetical protein
LGKHIVVVEIWKTRDEKVKTSKPARLNRRKSVTRNAYRLTTPIAIENRA